MIDAVSPSFSGLGLEDGHVPTFEPLLQRSEAVSLLWRSYEDLQRATFNYQNQIFVGCL